jgi:hypothetical protein
MAKKLNKQDHLDIAEIIGAYGEAIKKWPLGIRSAIIGILNLIFLFSIKFIFEVVLPIILDLIF